MELSNMEILPFARIAGSFEFHHLDKAVDDAAWGYIANSAPTRWSLTIP